MHHLPKSSPVELFEYSFHPQIREITKFFARLWRIFLLFTYESFQRQLFEVLPPPLDPITQHTCSNFYSWYVFAYYFRVTMPNGGIPNHECLRPQPNAIEGVCGRAPFKRLGHESTVCRTRPSKCATQANPTQAHLL